MTANYVVKDGNGSTLTIRSTDDGGGNQIPMVRLTDATGANFSPVMAAVGSAGYVYVTDGTHTLPTGDAVARSVFAQLSDASTGPVAVKAASTAAAVGDKALVVSLSPNSPAATNADATLTAGTAPSKALALAGQYLKFSTLPACATAQTAALQIDPAGNQKVGVVPLGTPVYGTASSGGAAAANVSLTIPANTMGYLDGFDIDGLGATAGSAVAVTITGLVGGTLTYLIGVPAGVTVPFAHSKRFNPPLQGSTMAQAIGVTVASFGSGNTASTNNTYGHYV